MSTIPYIETTEVLVDYLVSSLKPESGKPLSRDDAMSILRAIANGIEDGDSVGYIAEVLLGGIPEDAVTACLPVVSIMLGRGKAPAVPVCATDACAGLLEDMRNAEPLPETVIREYVNNSPWNFEGNHPTFDVPPVTFSRPLPPDVSAMPVDAVTPSRPDDELAGLREKLARLKESQLVTLPNEIALLRNSQLVTIPNEIARLRESLRVTIPNELRRFRDLRASIPSEIRRIQDEMSELRRASAPTTPKPEPVEGAAKRARGKARAKPYYHFGQFTPNARKALIKRATVELRLEGAQAPNEGPRGPANKYARLWFNVETIAWQLQFDIERGATASMLKEDNPAYALDGIQDAIKIVDRAIEIAMSEASEVLLQVPTGPGVRIQKSNTDANVAHTPIDAPQQPAILQP